MTEIQERYGDIHGLALKLREEILNRKLELKPIRIVNIIDRSNGKPRELAVESPKRQICNYIASNALKELDSRCGYYQVNMRAHGSPIVASAFVKGWMNDKNCKYVAHLDVKKCYPSIKRTNMIAWLKRHVKNDNLIWLINELLSATDCLSIGSFLSIRLCGLYMSDAYHYISQNFKYYRKGKSIKIIKHFIVYLDDIFLFSANARKLNNAVKQIIQYFETIGLTIKEKWKLIYLKGEDAHIDILGYKIYADHVTMRRRDYVKFRKAVREFKNNQRSIKKAMTLVAYCGLFLKHTDSVKFDKKYNVSKYYKLARKVVSDHGKSIFLRETGNCFDSPF